MFAPVLSWDLGIVVVPSVWLKPRPCLLFSCDLLCLFWAMGNAARSSRASPTEEALRTSKDIFLRGGAPRFSSMYLLGRIVHEGADHAGG